MLKYISLTKKEFLFLFVLLVLAAVPRFAGLGYSHFYGDETKALYVDKTVPASTFFLDQRKGPMQFFIAWTMEKLSGGFNEFWTRIPFAKAGIISVLIFYFLVRILFDKKTAFLSATFYAFSGFSVAFSRTVQYQSFLAMFGFLGLFLFFIYRDCGKRVFLFLSSIAFALAFLCHYDAVFFVIPVFLFLTKQNIKHFGLFFIVPLLAVVSAFYVPYVLKGYFSLNTLGYITRRISGTAGSLPNNSLYTFFVYNPLVYYLLALLLGALLFVFGIFTKKIKPSEKNVLAVLIWFLVPFLTFTLVFQSPGTHILNYFIPLYVLSSIGFIRISNKYLYMFVSLVLVWQIISVYYIFIPQANSNYPWKGSHFAFLYFPQAERKYQLFLYGFPYNRSWEKIATYLNALNGARNFYTNDNTVVAKYYVAKLDLSAPGSNFYPRYYVYVNDNQEFKYPDNEFISHYETAFTVDGQAVIYKLKP